MDEKTSLKASKSTKGSVEIEGKAVFRERARESKLCYAKSEDSGTRLGLMKGTGEGSFCCSSTCKRHRYEQTECLLPFSVKNAKKKEWLTTDSLGVKVGVADKARLAAMVPSRLLRLRQRRLRREQRALSRKQESKRRR